jgi:hypothetical protein
LLKHQAALMKESMLNKKNGHSYPSHIVAVIESGAIARPLIQRKLASAKMPFCHTIARNKHENAAASNNSKR